MKKYNSIKEREEEKNRQKNTWNQRCIEAMTDEELSIIRDLVEKEQRQRKIDDEISERNGIATSANADY